ncbi:hypothetical protein Glove_461g60 [Diversispora epigaea]|uniref:Uncharacterized protein n=1 Tax=Diversispora epigaea TaxID=1348612 RepID=A0A397GWG4_9GLOM|nr:hypothetical protein Glove_461g60 [Diversispora epigaea]
MVRVACRTLEDAKQMAHDRNDYGFVIEVQGQQHEKYIEFFLKKDPINFIRQQTRDQLKKELCENGTKDVKLKGNNMDSN